MKRYHLRVFENRVGSYILKDEQEDGEWVKYKDVERIIQVARYIVVNKHNFTIGDVDGLQGITIDRLAELIN